MLFVLECLVILQLSLGHSGRSSRAYGLSVVAERSYALLKVERSFGIFWVDPMLFVQFGFQKCLYN
jgi:hypothetical protein